jgi:hypothetical protein
MSAVDYIRLDLKCPHCDLYLFGTRGTGTGDKAVFCSECRAGGSYEQIVEKKARLIPRFVSHRFVEKLLRHEPAAGRPSLRWSTEAERHQ